MFVFLFGAVGCVCMSPFGLCAEECSQGILAKRQTFLVPAGDTLSLSCVVRHCEGTWTGNWTWEKPAESSANVVLESKRHRVRTAELTANETRLTLTILNANTSDDGSYRCRISWGDGGTAVGHWAKVNVTGAPSHQRSVLHRVLVCGGAFLCLPVILGLARCLSSEATKSSPPYSRVPVTYAVIFRRQPGPPPQPPPRRPVPQKRRTATPQNSCRSEQKSEVVYADISQDAPREQDTRREPVQSTIYSAVKFS